MKFLESWRLLISTLSPVHVGCGEDYEPTNYVIENDMLYEFDPCAAMTALTIQDREQLLNMVRNPNNNRMLQEVQAFFYRHRQALMSVAKRSVPAVTKLVEFYEGRVGKTVQTEGDGSQLVNKLAIGRTFFNPISGAPILPGSSLKGAIRTALLDGANHTEPLLDDEKDLAKRGKEEANRRLQKRLFQYREFEQDPMRLVQLADAVFLESKGVGSELRFAVNRRRKVPKSGDDSEKSLAERSGLYQLLECVPASRFRVFFGQLTVQQMDSITDARLPSNDFRWNIQQIAEACNHFYRPQLESELVAMQECGYLDVNWATMIKQLLNGTVGQKLDHNQAFLLRVGRHSGAESVTINGVRLIKILLGKDSETGKMRSEYRANGTSWWLAANDTETKTAMLPFGWLLVELQPIEQPLLDWPEVQEILAGLKTESNTRMDSKRQQMEITRQLQIQEQARQQAAIAKAARSPEQKAIAELREWFIADRKSKQLKPVGRVVGTLKRLLNEATTWPLVERQDLATLAEEIFSQKSVSSDEKTTAQVRAKVQQLRQGEV